MRGNVNKRIKEPLETHNEYTIYTDVDRFRNEVLRKAPKSYVYDNHSKIIRVSAGFDIETTRVEERTYMYHWQFSFNKTVLISSYFPLSIAACLIWERTITSNHRTHKRKSLA